MKTTTNVFLGGLTTDMHPLTTPQLNLTDALNATLITFNGNELMLLNDMGNTRIQDSKTGNIMGLREGFIPIGMKEHGGIMYIASVNKEGKGELGTIPSPVITYKPLEDKESDDPIDFTWVADSDESKVFMLYDKEINPEEIFTIEVDDPASKGISSLTEKHLYKPHLIAITPKGEKDITPTVAISGLDDYWFCKSLGQLDLEILNTQIESDERTHRLVNFLSYPKILPGKLGIKFTKENISEFNLAPNGKYDYGENDVPKCYPVLLYIERNGVKTFYSSVYGVYYKTESDVEIDKIVVTYKLEDLEPISKSFTVGNFTNNDLARVLIPNKHKEYYIIANNTNWPASDTVLKAVLSMSNIYSINLGADYNKWIHLKIEYYMNGWNNPLGVYEMTYNPYYMDTLNQFVIKRYWKIHTFDGGKYSFPQYREWDSNNATGYALLGTLTKDMSSTQTSSLTPSNYDAIMDFGALSKVKLEYDRSDKKSIPLIKSINLSWSFTLSVKDDTPDDDDSNYAGITTYLRQRVEKTHLVDKNDTISKVNFHLPFHISSAESDKLAFFSDIAATTNYDAHGTVSVNYSITVSSGTQIIGNTGLKTFKIPKDVYVLKKHASNGNLYFYESTKSKNEWDEYSYISFNGYLDVELKDFFQSDTFLGGEFTIDCTILSIDTTVVQSYGRNHNLLLSFQSGHPTLEVLVTGGNSTVYYFTVPYKSDAYVYPQVDAVVQVLDSGNNVKEVPACVVGNAWNPILIDYKKNYITLSNRILSSNASTGYTGLRNVNGSSKQVQGSFNLDGLELYCSSASVENLLADKYYLYKNNDTEYNVSIKCTSNEESCSDKMCIIKPTLDNISFVLTGDHFRSIGIYEITGEIEGVSDSQQNNVFIGIDNISVNNLPLSECVTQSVLCYAEDSIEEKSYQDGLVTCKLETENHGIATLTWSIEHPNDYLLEPVSEHGYLDASLVYEKNTSGIYVDANDNEILAIDIFGDEIKFRNVSDYHLLYPSSGTTYSPITYEKPVIPVTHMAFGS